MNIARRARLLYVVGPSGAGKDSLLRWLRPRLRRGVRIAPRVTTRPLRGQRPAAERVVSLERFDALARRGAFVLAWQANGHHYGVPRVIGRWLARGEIVFVNGSRACLAEARRRFAQLETVLVTAPVRRLRERLERRARETPAEIAARLARNDAFARALRPAHRIANDGRLESAGRALLRRLGRRARR